jgi:hypothetical protein
MDTDYQQRNSQNMQALISYARERPNPAGNTIEYKQAGRAVLLGKGHSAHDIEQIEGTGGDWVYSGRIAIELDKTKRVLQKTEKKVIFRISPQKKGGMRELEVAITEAVAGTDIAGTPIEFSWA